MHVVVIGCGIVGASCAYSLAKRGVDVTVCEAGSIGGGSTSRSVGGIRTQFSTPVNAELSLASLPVWESFDERFGVDIAFRQAGYLFLAREAETEAAFRETVEMQRELGVPVELLDPEAAREHCPELHAESFTAATYAPCDGFADPYLALQGYVGAARDAGVEIRTKTPVTDVVRDGSAASGKGTQLVTGVVADGDLVKADAVINAAGPWAGAVAELAGIDLPITPKRRQVAVVDTEPPMPEDVPLTIDLDTGAHFRPERDGAALVGGEFGGADPTQDPNGFDGDADLDWTVDAIEHASDVAGYFGPETRLKRGWAGLYAVTPDHHPIVEESIPGFVNAAGFSGHGFQHAPATGRIVAELVVDGEASLLDVDPLSSDRFEDGEFVVERNVA